MTATLDIWHTLGIAATNDIREIRRGYARALKQIDVDAEPERFAALRDAFEFALAIAESGFDPAEASQPDSGAVEVSLDDERWADAPIDPPRIIETVTNLESVPAVDPAPVTELSPPDLWRQAGIDHAVRHAQALETMLLAEQGKDIVPLPAEIATMREHWQAITKDPRMEELGHFVAVESWIAETLARAWPLSEPLMPDVAGYFGWVEKAEMIGQSHAVQFIVRRLATSAFEAEVSAPNHPLHKAWRELTTPAREGSLRGRGVKRKNVQALLERVRRDYPELEHRFDSWRVGLWENDRQVVGWGGIWIVIVVAIQLLRFLGSGTDTPSSAPPTPVAVYASDKLTTASADIDKAIKALSHNYVDGAALERRNPELFGDLQAIWANIKAAKGDYWDLQASISESITARFNRVVGKASYAPVAALRQVTLEQARYFREQGAEQCAAYLTGQGTLTARPPEALSDRYRQARYDVLLDAGPDRPGYKRPKSFLVPGPLVKAAARAAHMDIDTFSAAMNLKGTPSQLCDTNIALISEALKMPKKAGLPILRAL